MENMIEDYRMQWDATYKKEGENVPWYLSSIPSFFARFSERLKPCRALDVGCGLGQYAHFLQQRGFDVTGIDFSGEVISRDRQRFPNIRFLQTNVLELGNTLKEKYDFIYDISLFHHILPQDRTAYATQIKNRLSKNGLFIVCTFSNKDKYFVGKKQLFTPWTGTNMYPISLSAIRETFNPLFNILRVEPVTYGKEYDEKRWFAVMKNK